MAISMRKCVNLHIRDYLVRRDSRHQLILFCVKWTLLKQMLSKVFSNQSILSRIAYSPGRFFASAAASNAVSAIPVQKPKVNANKKAGKKKVPVPLTRPKHKTPFRR